MNPSNYRHDAIALAWIVGAGWATVCSAGRVIHPGELVEMSSSWTNPYLDRVLWVATDAWGERNWPGPYLPLLHEAWPDQEYSLRLYFRVPDSAATGNNVVHYSVRGDSTIDGVMDTLEIRAHAHATWMWEDAETLVRGVRWSWEGRDSVLARLSVVRVAPSGVAQVPHMVLPGRVVEIIDYAGANGSAARYLIRAEVGGRVLEFAPVDFAAVPRIRLSVSAWSAGSGAPLSCLIDSPTEGVGAIAVFDVAGRALLRRRVDLRRGNNSIDLRIPHAGATKVFLSVTIGAETARVGVALRN